MNRTLKTICVTGMLTFSLVFSTLSFADSIPQDHEKTNIEIQLVRVPLPGKFPEIIAKKESSSIKNSVSENKKLSSLPKTAETLSMLTLIGSVITATTLFIFLLTNKNRKEDKDVYN
ncbi:LPXTG cell wall anchor domain-containing protein [Enterococcus sp. E5-79]|uniref:LPXTG cell wall anchor domain-containing protein n=1 Tax=Enterococcus sp. E5-79 TaxID=3002973 RepID=UPI001573654C|nr:LPXTG cell wall anchor domain-containing protein [Enterococcus sp. E5-79]EMF0329061.1 LPXTG cell wall anchor domain-containing protein [Enterococcus faecium]MEB4744255.1 LPXTG cell wall anchor domain-containing protein [Enterococcus sp. E5-79]NTK55391.1 LPXTG cell wall anchor domain-containing protein [Enterococcus faecium]